jgi:hypothetical protein
MPLTPEDLQNVRSVVQRENLELAEAVADIMAAFVKPLTERIVELEKSAGLLIEGQTYVEKLCAHLSDQQPENEPWRESLRDA